MEKNNERSSTNTLIMEIEKKLLKKLNEFYDTKETEIVSASVKVTNLKLKNIKDTLISIGNIVDEDLKEETYVGYIKSGAFSLNRAYVAVGKDDDKAIMVVYSPEGLIKQNTSKKAIEKFKKEIKEIAKYN